MSWWRDAFDHKYFQLYAGVLTPDRTRREVDFLLRTLKPEPTNLILDAACGYGRHAIELATRGYRVVGIDQSLSLIRKARRDSAGLTTRPTFLRMDVRSLDADNEYDIAINLFTSFGYFADSGNRRFLAAVARALKPGGRFLIDVLNKNWKVSRMNGSRPLGRVLRASTSHEIRGRVFRIRESVNLKTSRWKSSVRRMDGAEWAYRTDVRLYDARELKALFKEQGLVPLQSWGDFKGTPFSSSRSARIICLTKKERG